MSAIAAPKPRRSRGDHAPTRRLRARDASAAPAPHERQLNPGGMRRLAHLRRRLARLP